MNRYTYAAKRIPELIRLRMRGDEAGLERAIFEIFSVMGGVYVKFLQILISNTKMLRTLSSEQRMSVFNNSKPAKINHRAIMTQRLGMSGLRQFAHIDAKPFATGSFANVYNATLQDGTSVIVKIKRPGLRRQLRVDFAILRGMVALLSAVQTNAKMDISAVAKEYAEGITREVDYHQEIQNALRFYESYKDHPTIVVPYTYGNLSDNHIIVQQRMHGPALSDVLNAPDPIAYARSTTGSALKRQVYNLGLDALERSFSGKEIHGDPHPGNVILLQHDKVALIDFGLIAEPAKDNLGYLEYMKEQTFINKGQLRPGKFALQMMRSYSQKLYHALHFIDGALADGQIFKGIEAATDNRFYQRAIDPAGIVARMQHGYTTEIFDSVINPNNELSLSSTIDGLRMRRALHTIWTTIISMGLYKELIPPLYEEAVRRGQLSGGPKKFVGGPSDLDEAMEIIADWLSDLRETDPLFFQSVRKLFPESLSAAR